VPRPDATKRRIEKVYETRAPGRHHLLRCDGSNSCIDSESYFLINLKSFNAKRQCELRFDESLWNLNGVQAVPVIFTAWPLGPGGGTANIPSDAIRGDRALVARPEKEVESVARTATAPFGNTLSSANSKLKCLVPCFDQI
jgi:hypothetical protein